MHLDCGNTFYNFSQYAVYAQIAFPTDLRSPRTSTHASGSQPPGTGTASPPARVGSAPSSPAPTRTTVPSASPGARRTSPQPGVVTRTSATKAPGPAQAMSVSVSRPIPSEHADHEPTSRQQYQNKPMSSQSSF